MHNKCVVYSIAAAISPEGNIGRILTSQNDCLVHFALFVYIHIYLRNNIRKEKK